jgi:hypothetical protein
MPTGLFMPARGQVMNRGVLTYPSWTYFARNARAPDWARDFVEVVRKAEADVDTRPLPAEEAERLTSDRVLACIRPGLQSLGYTVESGKKSDQKIKRPVLFGEGGTASVNYEIDAFHDVLGVAVEVEAGRGAFSNADYRDIIRVSLLLDARFMVLMQPLTYRTSKTTKSAYAGTRDLLDAIYASQRLRLPFDGLLLVGY